MHVCDCVLSDLGSLVRRHQAVHPQEEPAKEAAPEQQHVSVTGVQTSDRVPTGPGILEKSWNLK